ncbi:hypothetical protein [Parashewanella tropica]|uniref:hypothetical protein n=1 Tax=Parashewanella tropica TaxID=2547970 RepID=UPI00105A2629|nr:hypothetical protein [Parashewanella tropica]
MKKLLLCAVILSLSACKSTDIRNIADSVKTIAGMTKGNAPTAVPGSANNQYSTKNEQFYITKATRMKSDLGAIRSVSTEKNPQGMTMVRFVSYHQDSGAEIKSKQYLYPVSKEGWLVDDPVTVHYYGKAELLNSGNYYLKSESTKGKFYTTGDLKLKAGVTNVVTIDMY